jgi:hypothetical protein
MVIAISSTVALAAEPFFPHALAMLAPERVTAVTGLPRLLLRLEGLAFALLAVLVFARLGESWWLFAVLVLAPDLSFFGYLAGPRIGALAYNAAHSLIGPVLLAAVGILLQDNLLTAVAAIWIAHIGFDRALGYGLKYGEGFTFTHLGRIGKTTPQL